MHPSESVRIRANFRKNTSCSRDNSLKVTFRRKLTWRMLRMKLNAYSESVELLRKKRE